MRWVTIVSGLVLSVCLLQLFKICKSKINSVFTWQACYIISFGAVCIGVLEMAAV